MSTKHTPAPWVISGTKKDRTIRAGLNGFVVAEVTTLGTINTMDGTGEANTRLIAAAPDLLEALQWALTELTEPENSTADTLAETIYKATEAIKKATK